MLLKNGYRCFNYGFNSFFRAVPLLISATYSHLGRECRTSVPLFLPLDFFMLWLQDTSPSGRQRAVSNSWWSPSVCGRCSAGLWDCSLCRWVGWTYRWSASAGGTGWAFRRSGLPEVLWWDHHSAGDRPPHFRVVRIDNGPGFWKPLHPCGHQLLRDSELDYYADEP